MILIDTQNKEFIMEKNHENLFMKRDNNDRNTENWSSSKEINKSPDEFTKDIKSVVVSEKLLIDINNFINRYPEAEARTKAGRVLIKYIMMKTNL